MTKVVNKLRSSIDERLSSTRRKSPHQAAALAYDICLLRALDKDICEVEFDRYREAYRSVLATVELTDALTNQVNYAIRIASHSGELEYEEMFKLFTLCDSINAMQILGLKIDEQSKSEFEAALKERFRRDKKKARMVAEDLVEDWKKDWWWYVKNLATDSEPGRKDVQGMILPDS